MLQLFLIIVRVVVTSDKFIASIFKINENPGQGKNTGNIYVGNNDKGDNCSSLMLLTLAINTNCKFSKNFEMAPMGYATRKLIYLKSINPKILWQTLINFLSCHIHAFQYF